MIIEFDYNLIVKNKLDKKDNNEKFIFLDRNIFGILKDKKIILYKFKNINEYE